MKETAQVVGICILIPHYIYVLGIHVFGRFIILICYQMIRLKNDYVSTSLVSFLVQMLRHAESGWSHFIHVEFDAKYQGSLELPFFIAGKTCRADIAGL